MLKQDHICGWCNKTDELAIMQQGGIVHTICIECGSLGPCVSLSDVWSAYRALRTRLAEVEKERDEFRIEAKKQKGTIFGERKFSEALCNDLRARLAEAEAHLGLAVGTLNKIIGKPPESPALLAREIRELVRETLAKLEKK